MKLNLKSNLFILHLTVLVWGFTGVLGALISIGEAQLVWYRVLIAAVSLFIYFKWKKTSIKVSKQTFFRLFFTGAIVGLHWLLFFGSIKASTVSVAMVCLSSLTLFTAILEPILNRSRISKMEILAGAFIIFGIYVIFKFESDYTTGIIMGLASALCASLFSIINAKQAKNRPATIISFYELTGAFFWISLYLAATGGFNSTMYLNITDLSYLLLLGTVCTSIAYVAGVSVMKELSAFKVALITNLEPIYAIILALIIFGKGEQMTSGFYIGALIILSTIFLFPIVKTKVEHRKLKKIPPII
ncbi:DMT family transporter [Pedobacter arcticus]|uniref:DMT family transporter n=1 Tax=Pedobacter arcticus TaxID=752140 RepID=UPI0002F5083B|nr:DMT family transporter [Pedobacter arcticus]